MLKEIYVKKIFLAFCCKINDGKKKNIPGKKHHDRLSETFQNIFRYAMLVKNHFEPLTLILKVVNSSKSKILNKRLGAQILFAITRV